MEDPEARQGPEEDVVDLVAEEEEEQQQQGGGGWAAAAPRARWAAAAAAAGPAGGAAAAAGQQAAEEEELAADIMREAASGVLLPFQRAMVEELLEEDGLCVLSPGLGLHHVVAVLLRLQDARLRQPGQRGCVLVLGASPWQRDALRRELLRIDPVIRAKAQAVAAGRAASAAGARAAAAFEVPGEVRAEVAAAERQALYASRSCLFVTTRILVVDQLSGRISGGQVAGMVVLNAHRVTDSSGEGFAVRLYKAACPEGVVRAFSDVPSSFSSEFNKVEKVMKALYVRRLYLWPRFQAQAREDLEARPPQLVELSQPMSSAMGLMYEAITELMDACVRELRKTNKLDTSDLTVEQGLFRSFDEAVRRQLAPIWHTVSPKTRQIVADLRTLRGLASYMLRFDAVTFMSYLDNLRATEGVKSVWLFHSAAHTIFEAAKSRVYRLKQGGTAAAAAQRKRKAPLGGGEPDAAAAAAASGGGGPGPAPVIEAVLESMPKWDLLREVMEEIQQERQAVLQGVMQGGDGGAQGAAPGAAAAAAAAAAAGDGEDEVIMLDGAGEGPMERQAAQPGVAAAAVRQAAAAPVLVVCQDTFTAGQLREVLKSGGPAALMQRLYRDYLQYKLDGGSAGAKRRTTDAAAAAAAGAGQPGASAAVGPGGGSEVPPSLRMMGGYRPGEEIALIKEAKSLAGGVPAAAAAAGRGGRGGGRGGRGRGRKGGRGQEAAAAAAALAVASTSGRGHLESPPPAPARGQAAAADDADADADASPLGAAATDGAAARQPGGEAGPCQQAQHHPLLDGVRFVALEAHDVMALWEAAPGYVVVYDPDVAFTRHLELYKAARPGQPLCVYLLRYEDSFEMDRYQAAVARERQVFESLIRNKEIMILPIAAAREQVDPARRLPATHRDEELPLLGGASNALTRRAGGRAPSRPDPKRVVVDVREFMSSLPAVLHQQASGAGWGLEVVPLTLEVGDYVLSPDICAERKSISDLRASLASGRLYHQAEAMTKHYKTPVLLIEFEGDKAFALQASSEIGDEVQLHSLMGRIALLVLHFPRLRLIWSRSLHATADIFQQLKANQDEPDPVTAATVGVPVEAEGAAAAGEAVVNQAAIDLLRRLPGVTEANWRSLMREVGSLAELADVPVDRLATIMGGQAAARKLHEFLSQECKALFSAL
ncbi:hypothetical protein CHLNCDRAFT_134272 [Chlorella variabilis]|uniref:ERCC4 domain-containing protein n=1 Tax=Chlorella variabilis TaxID=554065 RepID=E1ZFN1_CHLVA|nr:hypothetical protein CHLNCDRAFT_134272 [Chlorella variabilis]EFN55307.1 hypothetical protein CHLNCDRAFT_134272 [Chlorella variabilis]|eukprot:XP_005847409.1 hypothetical protein CHLNCDRAFT_134272 [Chlorella variabilis]